jgi:hypothetical protein
MYVKNSYLMEPSWVGGCTDNTVNLYGLWDFESGEELKCGFLGYDTL